MTTILKEQTSGTLITSGSTTIVVPSTAYPSAEVPSELPPTTEPRKIEVTEIFASVQGEGPSLGVPAIFVRTRRCPLRCLWCDTMYAVDPQHPEWNKFEELTSEEIIVRIRRIRTQEPLLVLTGGEPMLWQKQLAEVAQRFQMMGHTGNTPLRVEVETSGVIEPKELMPYCSFNVSPKLESSGNVGRKTINPKAMEEFVRLSREDKAIFKFVVTREQQGEDLMEIAGLIADYGIENRSIYLMPEGVTPKDILEGGRRLVPVCRRNGWHLTTRLQIHLWGNRRGT